MYCDDGYEYRCGNTGLKGLDGSRQACADGVTCVEGTGCQGARQVELGSSFRAGSLDNVAFAGEVLQFTRDATLTSYSVQANLYDEPTQLDWQVYEAPSPTGPFQRRFRLASQGSAGGGDHESPALSVPVVAGRYYLLGVGVPPTVIFELGGLSEGGGDANPLGITWSQTQPSDGFSVNALTTEPGVLIGRALFEL